MTTRNFVTTYLFRPALLLVVVMGGILTLIGSGGGGGGGDVDDSNTTQISGMEFTSSNLLDAVALGIGPLSLFHPLSQMAAGVIQLLEIPIPSGLAYNLSSELCIGGGSASLTWSDVLPSGVSVGDSAVLTFTDCDIEGNPLDPSSLTGSIQFALNQYDSSAIELNPYLSERVAITLSIEEILGGSPSIQTIDGDFLARIYRSSTDATVANWWFRYGDRTEDPDALLTVSENSTAAYQFGCFDVSVSYHVNGLVDDYLMGDNYLSHLYGIAVANNSLLTVTGTPPSVADLDFDAGLLERGSGLNFYGFVLGDGCSVLGVPDGVSTIGNANIAVTPIGGGWVNVDLYSSGFGSPPDLTQTELWDDLY